MPRIHSLYYQICQCHPKLFWNHFRLEHALIVQKFNVDFRAFQSHPVRKVWSYFVISRRWCFNIFGGALCNCIFINRQRGCSEIWWPVQKINFALSLMLYVCMSSSDLLISHLLLFYHLNLLFIRELIILLSILSKLI